VHQAGHYPELHQDARSTKHKILCYTILHYYFIIIIIINYTYKISSGAYFGQRIQYTTFIVTLLLLLLYF
jgi:hypothetical protein